MKLILSALGWAMLLHGCASPCASGDQACQSAETQRRQLAASMLLRATQQPPVQFTPMSNPIQPRSNAQLVCQPNATGSVRCSAY